MKKLVALASLFAIPAVPAFAAAPTQTFTGTLEVADVLCIRAPCVAPVSLKVGGVSYRLNTDRFFSNGELAALRGATVKITGSLTGDPVGGGSKAILDAIEPASDTIQVKGMLAELYFDAPGPGVPIVPHVGNMELAYANPEATDGTRRSIVVASSRNWLRLNYHNVWLTGTVTPGGGDLATYFTATRVRNLGAADLPGGLNVAREGRAGGSSSTAQDGAPGGGQSR